MSAPTVNAPTLRQRLGRRAVKTVLDPLLRWRPLEDPAPGFSIILGVPWDLRHLLNVNLMFVARTDTRDLHRVQVVFDRPPRPGADEWITRARETFPDLPLSFRFHEPLSGWICNKVNVSTFYNSMNTVLGIRDCETRYVVLHDFDLYPLVPDYFTANVTALRERGLRFCGLERTHFEGLTDDDNILGTWALGIDVEWLRRNHRPIECFHAVTRLRDRLINLDPYSYLQTRTPQRGLIGTLDGRACCHVKNLCSTWLRFRKGVRPSFVWRLHYLWYLEYVGGYEENLRQALDAMRSAASARLEVGDFGVDFFDVHPTCANVLRDELERMETFLFGACRPIVREFVDAFAGFLERFGDARPVEQLALAARM